MERKLPHCIGFIMDGNRRWAKAQGLETVEGHRQGLSVLMDSIRFVRDSEISHAVYYAFSTENWNRSEKEVSYLMDLFQIALGQLEEELRQTTAKPVHIRFVGQWENLPTAMQFGMGQLEEQNSQYPDAKTTIWIALSYGGRAEILEAVNRAVGHGRAVTEETFKQLLWTADMPDPDIIVRTSGEQRLSNFLTWGSAYSELHFIEKQWPALTAADFEDILDEYATRERRRGS
jgi:undecaprenyl diphosphate synthase